MEIKINIKNNVILSFVEFCRTNFVDKCIKVIYIIIKRKEEVLKKKLNTVQNWLPYDKVLNNGIVKMKNNYYIKILKVSPINFNLKSNLEKESILNSYKTFLKTCNYDIQILIQSNKEDLSNHIFQVEEINKNKKEKIKLISKKYINFIQEINQKKKSSSKNFYILVKENPINKNKKINEENEKIYCEKLNEKYFQIKESLSRCGNIVINCDSKEEVERIIKSFLNVRKDLKII